MARTPRFRIHYAPIVRDHLRAIPAKYHRFIMEAIETDLSHDANRESINRKPLSPTTELEAEWELRCGPKNAFRVFYSVNPAASEVHVIAVGVKRGSRLRIGREEVRL
jgi:hypothetical protein